MISPTVGRKVWFRPNGTEKQFAFKVLSEDQALDATVTFVHSDRMVNLLIVDHVGNQFPMQSITLLQDIDQPHPGQMYCEWMPYQVGQAKRT